MLKRLMFVAALGILVTPALADSQGSATGGTAGTQSTGAGCINQTPTLSANQQATLSCNSSGALNVNLTGGSGGAVTTNPGVRTIVPLDISTVTTGGNAVTALNAGHRTAGGFLLNPIGATFALCINEQGTASGTTSAGALTCVQPGQSYTLTPAGTAVSVITSDSSHPFSGYGLN